jgi:hypothetical protein
VPAPSDDETFTVKISHKKQNKLLKSPSVAISEEALYVILPATPPPQTPDKSHSPSASYLSAAREKKNTSITISEAT